MKRRTFLYLPVLSMFSSLSFAKTDNFRISLDTTTQALFIHLSKMLADHGSAASIGNKYLAGNANLRETQTLLFNMGINRYSLPDEIQSSFKLQRSEDYRTSNTVMVDRWVLSMAEVSLCCAASILARNS